MPVTPAASAIATWRRDRSASSTVNAATNSRNPATGLVAVASAASATVSGTERRSTATTAASATAAPTANVVRPEATSSEAAATKAMAPSRGRTLVRNIGTTISAVATIESAPSHTAPNQPSNGGVIRLYSALGTPAYHPDQNATKPLRRNSSSRAVCPARSAVCGVKQT